MALITRELGREQHFDSTHEFSHTVYCVLACKEACGVNSGVAGVHSTFSLGQHFYWVQNRVQASVRRVFLGNTANKPAMVNRHEWLESTEETSEHGPESADLFLIKVCPFVSKHGSYRVRPCRGSLIE